MDTASHRTLVEAAIKAPSSHNTQPWRFLSRDGDLELLADRTRDLPVNDPDGRELVISCGAALFNIRVAAAARGLGCQVTPLPDPSSLDLLAVVQISGTDSDTGLAPLTHAIAKRHSTRKALKDTELPQDLTKPLASAAAAEGAALHEIPENHRADLAALVDEGDRMQFADPAWRAELARWMRPIGEGDGLPAPPVLGPVMRTMIRAVNIGPLVARGDRQLVIKSPVLVVLSTPADDPAHWLRAGQALQRLLLLAAQRGVQAGYLNQPCQCAPLRPRLAAIACPGESPQLLIRLGVPEARPKRSARRPAEAVHEISTA